MFHLNPYIAGDPIRSEQGFFGREDILKVVNNVLKNPHSNAIVLYGQRRIGKTSILLQLESKLLSSGTFTPVYFDLHDKASKPLSGLLYDLAVSICEVIGQAVPEISLFDESGKYFRAEFLPSAAQSAAQGGLVLLFDEFDVLDSPARATAGQSFFPYLRKWMAQIESVRFIFVIGRRPEDLSTDTLQTFKSIRATRVSRLDRASAEAMIRQSEKDGSLLWTTAAVERLWEICQGHSYLTQLMCSVIFEKIYDTDPLDTPVVRIEHIQESIADALDQGANAFHWIWGGLPPAERVVIAAMAEVEKDVITQEELIERLNRSGVRLIVRELELAPETLVEWELLNESNDGYGFVVPLFKQWVAKNRPLRRVKDELDRLDPIAENLFQTGQQFYGIGQLDGAESQLRQSLTFNPNHLKSRLLLGRILLEGGKAEESSVILQEAYEYDEGAARADLIKALLAVADTSNQEEQNRVSIYERILVIDRNQPIAREKLDQIFQERKAREILAKAKLAEDKEAKHNWKAAIEIYKELLLEAPGNMELSERLEKAIDNNVLALLKLAESHENKEEWSSATAIYKNLTELYPEKGDWEGLLRGVQAQAQLAENYNLALGTLEAGDKKITIDLLADIIYEQPDYKEAARFLLYALTDIDVKRLQEELEYLREVVQIEKVQTLARFNPGKNPDDYVDCPDCDVRVKAKNVTRHYIQHHGGA
jgi:tetratricopeptide (TPR) repeat protein